MHKKVFIMVGPAANGKSSWIKTYINKNKKENILVICADDIRAELYGSPEIQGDGREVFDILFNRYIEGLKNCFTDTIFIDCTSLTYKLRKRYFKICVLITELFEHEFIYTLVFFNVPVEEAIRRDANRDRVVSENVIRSHYERYQKANDSEKYLCDSLLNFNIIEA